MPVPRRRRRKRLSLFSFVPEKMWPRIIQGLLAVALAALPASAVKMGADGDRAEVREVTKANTSALVEALAVVMQERDTAIEERDRLAIENARWRAKYSRLAGTVPMGPPVPVEWTPAPPRRAPRWQFWKR